MVRALGRNDHDGRSSVFDPAQVRAAEYVRMSTEHQRYSTENQSDAIRQYALKRGLQIVQTYVDAGRSGLNIEGRAGLQRLLADVEGGLAFDGARATYQFRRQELSASELIGRVSQQYHIRDLSVREPDIETTIRRIYEERLLEG